MGSYSSRSRNEVTFRDHVKGEILKNKIAPRKRVNINFFEKFLIAV